jgi:uncharacterized protein
VFHPWLNAVPYLERFNVLYVQLVLLGACVGVISGLLGIGGGIVLVPGLYFLFGFSQQEAQGTSLAALCTPIFVFAAVVYYKAGYVKIPVAISIAVGIMLGAYVGARLLPVVPVAWLRLAFGGLLLYVGLLYVFGPYLPRTLAAMPIGVSMLLAAIGAWLHGRRATAAMKLPPPDGHTEYHI